MLWEWFWFMVPWWAKVILIGVPLAMAYIVVGMTVGWDKMRRWIVPAIILLVTFGMVNKFQQQGWKAKEARDLAQADKFIERARKTRQEAEKSVAKDSAAGKLRENPHGRWRD